VTIEAAMWWYFVIVSPLIVLAIYFFYRGLTARSRIAREIKTGPQEEKK